MEKISRILPFSPRLKKFDSTLSLPARPGAINVGRPEGIITAEQRISSSSLPSSSTISSSLENLEHNVVSWQPSKGQKLNLEV